MSDTDSIAVGGGRVNHESRFTRIRNDVERDLERSPEDVLYKLFSYHVSVISRPNGTINLLGMPCPWCRKDGSRESQNLYLLSNRLSLGCMSCGKKESVVFTFLEKEGLSIKDSDACCDRLYKACGVNSYEGNDAVQADSNLKFTDGLTIDIDSDAPVEKVKGRGRKGKKSKNPMTAEARQMTAEARQRIVDDIGRFHNRDYNQLSKEEKAAITFIVSKRGINANTIKKAKLYIDMKDGKILVTMPSFDINLNVVGFQNFDYFRVTSNGKIQYRSCSTSEGSTAWPFGVDTCVGKDSPILVVCGFFDYLSAIQAGFECVLSPFGITMLSSVDHISEIVRGRFISILFDRKIQEFYNSIKLAKLFHDAGAVVNVMLWMKGPDGFDFNDYIRLCAERGIGDSKENLNSLVGSGVLKVVRYQDGYDFRSVAIESKMKIEGYDMNNFSMFKSEVHTEECISISDGMDDTVRFEPDLNKAISGLDSSGRFHTLIMFSKVVKRFEMCETLDVKECKNASGCHCAVDRKIDISSGIYASAFANKDDMDLAVKAVCFTYNFPPCPHIKGYPEKDLPKKVVYKISDNSRTWIKIDVRSLFSCGSPTSMVTNIDLMKNGIYEVKGFKSMHCGQTSSVFVITDIKPYSTNSILECMPVESLGQTCYDFFDLVSYVYKNKMAGQTNDMVAIASACAWAFSPLVIPLIESIGLYIDNHRQPALSIYFIGDSSTGKTETLDSIMGLTASPYRLGEAKIASRAGIVASGDGSVGEMARSMGKFIGMNEITDDEEVTSILQLIVENKTSIVKSGISIDEVTPVRAAFTSNANEARDPLGDFRTPLNALTKLVGGHIPRRIDFIVATTNLKDFQDDDIDCRNHDIFNKDFTDRINNLDIDYFLNLSKRCFRQKPELIVLDNDARKFMLNEVDIISKIDIEYNGNVMMLGSLSQKIFRIACGIASFSGSFSGENLIVKMIHIDHAITMSRQMMLTMEASEEARFCTRTKKSEKSNKILIDICSKSLELMISTDDNMVESAMSTIQVICGCAGKDAGSIIDNGLNALRQKIYLSKTITSADQKLAPYNRAVQNLRRMVGCGLLKSEGRGMYSVTQNFFRAISSMESDCYPIYEKIFKN